MTKSISQRSDYIDLFRHSRVFWKEFEEFLISSNGENNRNKTPTQQLIVFTSANHDLISRRISALPTHVSNFNFSMTTTTQQVVSFIQFSASNYHA
jgi:hypothetical protein